MNTKKNHVEIEINLKATDAAMLLFHYLDVAAGLFEAGPTQPELLELFVAEYSDSTELGVRSKKLFIESLNSEYIEKFDDEAEAEQGEGE